MQQQLENEFGREIVNCVEEKRERERERETNSV